MSVMGDFWTSRRSLARGFDVTPHPHHPPPPRRRPLYLSQGYNIHWHLLHGRVTCLLLSQLSAQSHLNRISQFRSFEFPLGSSRIIYSTLGTDFLAYASPIMALTNTQYACEFRMRVLILPAGCLTGSQTCHRPSLSLSSFVPLRPRTKELASL